MPQLLTFIAYVCMLVLFVALIVTVSVAYKLFQIVRKRDTTNERTNKILNDLTQEIKRLKDYIDNRKT